MTQQITRTEQQYDFFSDIEKFNAMYGLPTPEIPRIQIGRLPKFLDIIHEEVSEGSCIHIEPTDLEGKEELNLADIADWLGDVTIYCISEMLRWGLDPAEVLSTIMQSNFSKLGADGKPIYDERGKVMKGPNYWKPESELYAKIHNRILAHRNAAENKLNQSEGETK